MDQIEQVPGSPLTEVAPPKLAFRPSGPGGAGWVVPVADDGEPQPGEAGGPCYVLVQDQPAGGRPQLVDSFPRWPDGSGAINAIDRAAHLSAAGEPVTVLRPGRDGEARLVVLARFVAGAREGRTRPLRAPVRAVD